jgi:hypothetical protein
VASKSGTTFQILLLIFLIGLVIVGLSAANYRFASAHPGGNDFLVHYIGTHSLIMEGHSPYSDTVARQIQTIAYGRPGHPGEHELRPAYPLYSALIFSPFALIREYPLARALWMTALEISLMGLAFISMRLVGWPTGPWLLAFFLLFALLWYHGVRPLINGNAVILVALLIGAVFLAIKSGKDELAGILLAFTTIKPHLVVLLIPFIFLWAISLRRWALPLWTVLTLVFLTGSAMLVIPDWPLQNLQEVLRYPGYNPPGTLGEALATWMPATGGQLALFVTAILSLVLLVEWRAARRRGFPHFLWAACLTLVAGQWIGLPTEPGNFIVLLIPLVLVLSVWDARWGKRSRPLVLAVLLLLFIGLWAIVLPVENIAEIVRPQPLLLLPLPFFLLASLYWVRWWAIRPSRLLVDELRGMKT